MTVIEHTRTGPSPRLGHNSGRRSPVYAVTFDFDTETLAALYPNESWRNAYSDVRSFFEENGFEHKQWSVYFATYDMSAVECITIVQTLANTFDWFTSSLKDIRMLRIEDNDDLMIALDRKRRHKSR